jgi:methanogenic corrinoid protein MtbC1
MSIPEVYAELVESIQDGEAERGIAVAKKLITAGHDVAEMFDSAIIPCLTDIGERFSKLEIFLPEMILAADVVKAIYKEIEGTIQSTEVLDRAGKVVIGTAYGDMHDLGKDIVLSMLEVNGFEVYDLGIDVPAQVFIKKAREVDADIVAISCLLTTSIPYMADTVELIKGSDVDRVRFKVLVGGGPVTSNTANEIGADAYGEDAADAVVQARKLLLKD